MTRENAGTWAAMILLVAGLTFIVARWAWPGEQWCRTMVERLEAIPEEGE